MRGLTTFLIRHVRLGYIGLLLIADALVTAVVFWDTRTFAARGLSVYAAARLPDLVDWPYAIGNAVYLALFLLIIVPFMRLFSG